MRVETVLLENIYIPDRARINMGDMDELVDSVQSYMGQIQSLAVMERDPNDDNIPTGYTFVLLAGGRRAEALRLAGITEVHVRVYPTTLTLDQQKEIELVENLIRKDFDWPEQAQLQKEIHDLRQRQARANNERHTLDDTAELLGIKSAPRLSENINLARIADKAPALWTELTKFDTKKEALKFLEKIQKQSDVIQKSKEFRETLEVSSPTEDPTAKARKALSESYNLGDALEGIRSIDSESIDFVLLDPIYASGFETKGNAGTSKSQQDVEFDLDQLELVTPEQYDVLMKQILAECYRVLRPNTFLVLFHSSPRSQYNFDLLMEAGYEGRNVPAVWNKSSGLGGAKYSTSVDYYLGTQYEPFHYVRKGAPTIRRTNRADVFNYPRPSHQTRSHPNEKPIDLLSDIITTFTSPNSRILSPFLGSGNDILASYAVNCRCFGFDLSEPHFHNFQSKVSTIDLSDLIHKGLPYVNLV